MKPAILDCTLRDGGYYSQWDFSDDLVADYLTAMQALQIDYVEIGYRSLPSSDYRGKYAYTSPSILDRAHELAPDVKLAVMVDEKSVDPNEFERLLVPCQGKCHLVRLAVAPENIARTLPLISIAKKLGFEIAVNMMRFHEIQFDDKLAQVISSLEPDLDFLYLVDSYGSASPIETETQFRKVASFSKSKLGFHGHDNMQLALANSLAAEQSGASILDCTMCGMGRGAGNLRTEVLLAYLAAKHQRSVDFNSLGQVVSQFATLQEEYRWGSSFPYIVSGAFGLPQKEVMDWLAARRYSVHAIVQALQNQNDKLQDNLQFPSFSAELFHDFDEVLVIGGGPTIYAVANELSTYLEEHPRTLLVFTSITHLATLDQFLDRSVLCLAGSEGDKIEKQRLSISTDSIRAFVLPPFPRKLGTQVPEGLHQRTFELPKTFHDACDFDSPLAVALGVANALKHDEVNCVGLDGYAEDEPCHELLNQENEAIINGFSELGMKLNSLTRTRFLGLGHDSIYSKVENVHENCRDHSRSIPVFPIPRKAAG